MKPTPCEHEWVSKNGHVYCSKCHFEEPTPEEKCSHEWNFKPAEIITCKKCGDYMQPEEWRKTKGCMCGSGYASDCNVHNPPEARVDWEKEAELAAREIYPECGCQPQAYQGGCDDCVKRSKDFVPAIAKALSAAFEKGREAR